MKLVIAGIAAALLVGLGWMQPAAAQYAPRGSYRGSCTDISMRGDTLVATCRRIDGGALRSALSSADRCVGDIGNNNGLLNCTYAGGRQAVGRVVGGGPGYAPPPTYGPPPGPGRDGWERCRDLRHEDHELRDRLAREWDPHERSRLEWRLRHVHEELERCRY